MIDLLSLARRPALYERTGESLWDDEHISKGMLQAHLSDQTDAASRKPETLDASCDFLATIFEPGARLLDLGCGPGLYGVRLSARGFRVTGADISRRSIAYAAAHDPLGRYLCLDYTRDELPGSQDAALLIYCDYAALTPCERRAVLARVRRAIKPGGLFVLDVFTPLNSASARDETSWSIESEGGFYSPNPHVLLSARHVYPEGVTADQAIVVERDRLRAFTIWDTPFTQDMLKAELASGGFMTQGVYADCTGAPWRDDSPTLFVVTRSDAL